MLQLRNKTARLLPDFRYDATLAGSKSLGASEHTNSALSALGSKLVSGYTNKPMTEKTK
jgi:hypothetical protein